MPAGRWRSSTWPGAARGSTATDEKLRSGAKLPGYTAVSVARLGDLPIPILSHPTPLGGRRVCTRRSPFSCEPIALRDRLEPGGLLVLSGVLASERDEVRDGFVAVGLAHEHTRRRGEGAEGWVAIVLTRPA